jgi:hypothetical protein
MSERKKLIVVSGIASYVARDVNNLLADGWNLHGEMFHKHYNNMPDDYTQFMWRWIYVDDETGQEVDVSQEKGMFVPERPAPIPTT